MTAAPPPYHGGIVEVAANEACSNHQSRAARQLQLLRSSDDFGPRARDRHRRLLDQELVDLGEDPNRVGVRSIDDVREGYFTHRIRSSIDSAPTPIVRQPRHLVAFYVDDAHDVIVTRIFHERQASRRIAVSKQLVCHVRLTQRTQVEIILARFQELPYAPAQSAGVKTRQQVKTTAGG